MEVLIKTEDAINTCNGASKIAEILDISRAAISQWGEYVPEASARGLLILYPSIPHVIKKPSVS